MRVACGAHLMHASSPEEMPHQGERHISLWLQRRPARSGASFLPRLPGISEPCAPQFQDLIKGFYRSSCVAHPQYSASPLQPRIPHLPFFHIRHVTRHPKPKSWATMPRLSRSPTTCLFSCSWRTSSSANRVSSRSLPQLSSRDRPSL